MRKRLMAGAGAAAVGAACAITALVIGTTSGYAADTTSSAWGASATGQVPFSPTPYIESTDGTTQKSSSLDLPDQAKKYLNISAINVMAGNDTASSSLGTLSIPGSVVPAALQQQIDTFTKQLTDACDQAAGQTDGLTLDTLKNALPQQLKDITDVIPSGVSLKTLCDAAKSGDGLLGLKGTTVSCKGDTGKMSLGDVTLLGQDLSLPNIPNKNQKILDIPNVVTITANKQVKNKDGSFSITGLSINLAGQETLNLLGATCGKPQAKVAPTSSSKSQAPKPSPVTTNLPVTG